MKNLLTNIALVILISISYGCRKFNEVNPPIDKITSIEAYSSDASAANVLSGIYNDLSFGSVASNRGSIGFITSVAGDEIDLKSTNTDNDLLELYQDRLTNISNDPKNVWQRTYAFIYRVNSAIDGINSSNQISENGKKQLIGEASFLRAFFYFYLVNLYGDVPLVLSTNTISNAQLGRSDKSLVYQQIINDLLVAKSELSNDYLSGDIATVSTERVRPNKAVASALLARVYLYDSKWAEAETESSILIDDNNYILENLNRVFKKDSKEAIWQLQRSSTLQTTDASLYYPTTLLNGQRAYYLSDRITNSFEAGDLRKAAWTYKFTDVTGTYYYPAKYRDSILTDNNQISEYTMVFRLGEQYLIRAEARAYLGKLTGSQSSQSDINTLRVRAGLSPTNVTSLSDLLTAINNERKVELFTEWGNRWLDLKRINQIDAIMNVVAPLKGGSWSNTKALFPIPLSDMNVSPGLTQNQGY